MEAVVSRKLPVAAILSKDIPVKPHNSYQIFACLPRTPRPPCGPALYHKQLFYVGNDS